MNEQRNAAEDLAVCQAAAPGPWSHECGEVFDMLPDMSSTISVEVNQRRGGQQQRDANLAFIALAREALPWWIAEAQRLRSLLEGDGGSIVSLDADGLRVKHWAVRVLAESLAESIGDAPNFFQVEVTHPEQGQLVVTIRRKGGKTPEGLEVEQLRAENAHLQRSNEVMGEEWREGLSTTWDCIRLIRRALADGMTPELRQEMSEATTLNVHGESGQVEQLRRENAELKQQLGDALVATHNTVAVLRGELMRAQAALAKWEELYEAKKE